MTLTKEAITLSVFDRLDLSKAASAKAVEATFEIIKKTLEGGEDVLITGFGKFCVRDKGERRGRNPGTGVDSMLAFHVTDSDGLRDLLLSDPRIDCLADPRNTPF